VDFQCGSIHNLDVIEIDEPGNRRISFYASLKGEFDIIRRADGILRGMANETEKIRATCCFPSNWTLTYGKRPGRVALEKRKPETQHINKQFSGGAAPVRTR